MYYAPFRRCTHRVAPVFSLDLHVLGTPPTFVLSQDQTLQSTFLMKRDRGLKKLQVIRSLVKTQKKHVFRTCLKGPHLLMPLSQHSSSCHPFTDAKV